MALDFMAIARGRRAAEVQNQQDEDWEFQREQRDIKRQEQRWNQQAAAWLAPSLNNRQLAADAGVSAIDYELQQRQQTLANPEFQAMAPEVQNLILQKMQQRALLAAQTARDQGDITAANRVANAYGQQDVLGAVQEAAFRGQVDEALIRAGFPPDEAGMVNIGGVLVPKVQAAQQLIASGGVPGSVVGAAAQQAQNAALLAQQQTTAQQVAEQQRMQEYNQAMMNLLATGVLPAEAEARLAPFKPVPVTAPGIPAAANTGLTPTALQSMLEGLVPAAGAPALNAAQTAAVQAAGGVATPGFAGTAASVTPAEAGRSAAFIAMPPLRALDQLRAITQQLPTPNQLLAQAADEDAQISEEDALTTMLRLQKQLQRSRVNFAADRRTAALLPSAIRGDLSKATNNLQSEADRLREAIQILQVARARGAL